MKRTREIHRFERCIDDLLLRNLNCLRLSLQHAVCTAADCRGLIRKSVLAVSGACGDAGVHAREN
jgi:hypothetical protein